MRTALEDMKKAAGQEPSKFLEELRVWKAAHAEIEAQAAQAQGGVGGVGGGACRSE